VGNWIGIDARPSAVKTSLAYTLKRLGTDYVDILPPRSARPEHADRRHDRRNIRDGKSRLCPPDRAFRGGRRDDPQGRCRAPYRRSPNRIFSGFPKRRANHPSNMPCACVGVTAYGVLSRGLISGHWSKEKKFERNDFRSHIPRFQRRQHRPEPCPCRRDQKHCGCKKAQRSRKSR